jgi:tRNA-Thr(GGU) m(6)t(6)A37 methyltransferase TsaA
LKEEKEMRQISTILLAVVPLTALAAICTLSFGADEEKPKEFKVHPIGYVRKTEDKTTIVLDKKYEPGLLRMEKQSEIWVLWWFDRNDTPEKRSILQVHPRGNPDNPLTGVFATHSPVRPNLIAMTRCKIISVKDNVIEIESIDAFPDTPVLDIKS